MGGYTWVELHRTSCYTEHVTQGGLLLVRTCYTGRARRGARELESLLGHVPEASIEGVGEPSDHSTLSVRVIRLRRARARGEGARREGARRGREARARGGRAAGEGRWQCRAAP